LALATHTRAAQVERAGAARRATTPPDTEDGRSLADADADAMDVDDDEPDPAPKPIRKRREKKVVPMGQNGLAKRRVVKTRTTTDAKGFMGALLCVLCVFRRARLTKHPVTEDYSEYESVDEEDAPAPADKPAKKAAPARKPVPAPAKPAPVKPAAKSKPPEPGAKKVGQKNISNFFGKPAAKK
jgi:DNA polymerase delta subunit 3